MGPTGRGVSRLAAGLGAAVLLLAAQGCWFQTGYDHTRGGSNPLEETITAANVADLEGAWNASLPGAATDVLVRGRTAFVRTPGAVTALDTATGEERWTATSLGGSAAPAIAGDRLWVPTGAGTCALAGLDFASGERVSTATMGGPNLPPGRSTCRVSDALAVGGRVLTTWIYGGFTPAPGCPQGAWAVGSGVPAYDEESGAQSWTVDGSVSGGCGIPPQPPVPTEYRALSSDGTSVFVPTSSNLAAYPVADCGATPPGPCEATWSRALGEGLAPPAAALDNGDLAVPTADGRVVVLDGATGETQWTGNVGAALEVPLAATPTTIFAAAADGTLAAFPVAGCGAATCEPSWTATASAPPTDQPSVAGGVVYVNNGGAVTAFPAAGCGGATCEALWSAGVSDGTSGPPVIHDGTLYVGGTDASGSTLRAFRLPGG